METKHQLLFKEGVELYTGTTVKGLEVYEDPNVSDVYAIRAKIEDGDSIDFLLCREWKSESRVPNAENIANNLEKAMFTSWPPKTGALRFF